MKTLLPLVMLFGLMALSYAQTIDYSRYQLVTTAKKDSCECMVKSPEVSRPADMCTPQAKYDKLEELKATAASLIEFLKTLSTKGLKDKVVELTARVDAVDSKMDDLKVAVSVQNLTVLRLELDIMSGLIDHIPVTAQNNATLIQMREEIANMSSIVEHFLRQDPVDSDTDLLAEITQLRAQLAKLKGDLGDNIEDGYIFPGDLTSVKDALDDEICETKRPIKIGQPVTHQYFGVTGTWFKDALPSEENKTHIFALKGHVGNPYIHQWNNHKELLKDYVGNQINRIHPDYLYGANIAMYKSNLYYLDNSGEIVRKDIWNDHGSSYKARAKIAGGHTNLYYNRGNDYTYIDINVDEKGLWAAYTNGSDATHSNIMIARLDPTDLHTIETWDSTISKKSVSNVYFICGVMYTMNTYTDPSPDETQWGFDTKSNQRIFTPLTVPALFRSMYSMSYNPREQMLFAYDNGHIVSYKVFFN
ncbi:unnamed protein product [Owenia fusiformis]|uniref:Uncharacterized protein n=1 Tax=Owenia fusiformis TaxID=6347 RepID=A0A8J1TKD5_OWEFU|nr:unnamed protein product [Owenia fusiformis]